MPIYNGQNQPVINISSARQSLNTTGWNEVRNSGNISGSPQINILDSSNSSNSVVSTIISTGDNTSNNPFGLTAETRSSFIANSPGYVDTLIAEIMALEQQVAQLQGSPPSSQQGNQGQASQSDESDDASA